MAAAIHGNATWFRQGAHALLLAALINCSNMASAQEVDVIGAISSAAQPLFYRWAELNEKCASNDLLACDARDKVEGDLLALGYCHYRRVYWLSDCGFEDQQKNTTLAQHPQQSRGKSPLRCKVINRKTAIECEVTENQIVITNILLNRGNCGGMLLYASSPPGISATCTDPSAHGSPCKNNRLDPYIAKFGSTLAATVPGYQSCNIIEFTITVDGTDWTFRE
jgi:hypothetical protein